jgi:hypothetical protein
MPSLTDSAKDEARTAAWRGGSFRLIFLPWGVSTSCDEVAVWVWLRDFENTCMVAFRIITLLFREIAVNLSIRFLLSEMK